MAGTVKDKHIHFRITNYDQEKIDRYNINVPELCRRALARKIRDLVNDPDLLINEPGENPSTPFLLAWQRIMPVVSEQLNIKVCLDLKSSSTKLNDLNQIITSPTLRPEELEHLGIFLQGGDISEKILENVINAHLEGGI